MKFSDDTLMAYADGELGAQEREFIEAAMKVDPSLAQQVAKHQQLRRTLQSSFDTVLQEPVPERLVATARQSPAGTTNVVDLAAKRMGKPHAKERQWSWREWTAIAASLIVGVFAGHVGLRSNSTLVAKNGYIAADGVLAAALTQQASDVRNAPVDIGISFRAKSGDYCRTFVMHEGNGTAGMACRQGDDWRVQALTQLNVSSASGEYRQAATQLPPAILQVVETSMTGDALDAEQEAQARERNWKP